MKRANGEGNIRKRATGGWEGRYSVTENGKTVRRSVYGKTQAEVRKKMNEITNTIDNGVYIKPEKITVGEWFDIWHKEYLSDVTDSTKSQYEYQGRVHIKPRIGNLPLQSVTSPVLQRFYNQCGEKLSPKSVKNLHGVLHECLSQAVLSGYIKSNPADNCVLPRIEKREMQTIPATKIKEFREAIHNDPFENLYIVDVFTGMRQGEIIGLTWDCVDFEKGIIKVDKQFRKDHGLAGSQYGFFSTKTGKKRVLKPADIVMDSLRSEWKKELANKLKNGPAFNNADNLVFTNELGEHLAGVTVYNHLKVILKKIGLEGVRFHDLRHTYATLSIQNGDDLKTVSENLGHSTISTTADIYLHVTEEMKKASADRMNDFIRKVSGD